MTALFKTILRWLIPPLDIPPPEILAVLYPVTEESDDDR